MSNKYEYWYDPNHTGALRIIDHKNKIIYGSDPNEKKWIAYFEQISNDQLRVDFTPKKTHKRPDKIIYATYLNRKQHLVWSVNKDDNEFENVWQRIRVPLENVLDQL
jgi:hypothetical protein